MSEPTELDVIVRFYAPEQGGRSVLPNLAAGQYRPHLVLDADRESVFLGVQFIEGADDFTFDVDVQAVVRLLYENVDYSGLKPGATFKIMEGAKSVGQGSVA
ncbi:MAG: hypothetical protein R3B94_09230 [Hyphomonas sp.]